jgi:hypothetical protein
MKRWKKIAIATLAIIAISQVPFAYRRHQLSNLRSAIANLNASRVVTIDPQYTDYAGVVHVHSNLGGHSSGTLPEIVRAAEAQRLKFVVMTEHPSAEVDTAIQTLSGVHRGVLFIPGTEAAAQNGDRLLMLKGMPQNASSVQSTASLLDLAVANDRPALVAYPLEFHTWGERRFDGVEVYNLYTDARRVKPLSMLFDGIWSYRSFPDLLFARFFQRPSEALRLYDEAITSQHRHISLTAGNDAHQNVGFGLSDSTGKTFLYAQFDPYERSFATVRNHVVLEKNCTLDEGSLLQALKEGHSFVAFDIFCDATGFMFTAESATQRKTMGDEIAAGTGLQFVVRTPVKATVKLLREGNVLAEVNDTAEWRVPVTDPGAYRVEVYLPQLGSLVAEKPWIISNPIYVR